MRLPIFDVKRMEVQTMGKTIDFDKFIREKQKETIDVKVFGKTYKVPMEIPATVPVMMARAEEAMDGQQSTRMVMRAADAMFGSANVDEMCRNGMSAEDLATLVKRLFSEINGGGEDEDDETEELTDDSSKKQTGEGKKAKK